MHESRPAGVVSRTAAVVVIAAITAVLSVTPARAELYEWSDGSGVLRFTNADVMGNMDEVLTAILIAMGRDSDDPLSPTLPP